MWRAFSGLFLFMPTSYDPVGVCNQALSKIGCQAINSMLDASNQSALACNNAFQLAYLEVSRATKWNCIMTTAVLTQIPQTPLPGCPVPVNAPTWEPSTFYAANTYFTFGGYYYQTLINYTSSNNFTNDLTAGNFFVQTNLPASSPFFDSQGAQYPSGWAYQYALPSDFQLLVGLNDHTYWGWSYYGDSQNDYEIMGTSLFCDECEAVVQYVQNQPDTTRFDSLFMNCLTLKLASLVATVLRQDGGAMELRMLQLYDGALKQARTKNAGEKKERRFNPIGSSLFNRSRFGGFNGSILVPKWVAKIIWG